MHLDAAHPRSADARTGPDQVHLVSGAERAGEERAGHHGAESFHREGAIERQEERSLLRSRRIDPFLDRPGDGLDQLAQALTGTRRDLDDGRLLQERSGEQLAQLEQEQLAVVGAQAGQEVGLGERDDAGGHAEEPQDVEVLGGLRHRPLVGRDAEDRHVYAERGAHHRPQEPLVARDVHHPRRPDAGQFQVRVAGLERDAAALLFRQTVGVDPGQRLHQRRLPVIDMACCPDDDAQRGCCVHSSTQATPGASLPRSSAASPLITATGAVQ